jgi:Putative prokaryotic signal transducing protein
MADKDTEQERERLRRAYEGKSEGELEELAADAESLTPEAVQALEAEITRRKLDIALSKSADEVGAFSDELVTIRTFRDLAEATPAKGMLDSAGIQCVLLDDNVGRMLPARAVGGIRMQVSRVDANAALQLLTPSISEPCTCALSKQAYLVEVHVCPSCGKGQFVLPPDIMRLFPR